MRYVLLCAHFLLAFTQLSADSWAEKTLEQMTVDEKISQLFMIAGYVDLETATGETMNPQFVKNIDSFVQDYSVGGIGLVGPSTSSEQVALLNRYQKMSKYPILIAQDLEWGLSMRLKDGLRFPKNITLGTLSTNELIYHMGKEVARQGRLVGVHMNLSPDIDVNIEPENLVINVRSFGDCPQNVAEKGIAMIHGLQDGGMIASAKHFPGLGDITTDPHLDLPTNNQPLSRIEAVELYPFQKVIQAGVLSIQTDHVSIPALEPERHIPSSLSPKVVQGLLKEKMGFKGLVLSGALRMKALSKYFSQEEIAVRAFLAGSDMLLMPEDFLRAHAAIKEALQTGVITLDAINERVLKILRLKERIGLDTLQPLALPKEQELSTPYAKALKEKLYRSAVKVLRNDSKLLPLGVSKATTVGYLQIGQPPIQTFYETIKNKYTLDSVFIPLDAEVTSELQNKLRHLAQYPIVIVAIYPADARRIAQIRLLAAQKQMEELKNFRIHGLPTSSVELFAAINASVKKSCVVFFGNPFGLPFLKGFATLVMGYEDDPDAQMAAADLVSLRDL